MLDDSLESAHSDTLDWQRVAQARAGARVGAAVVYYPSIGSTNTAARALAREGARDGTVVLADEQTRGRGRHGRRWTAPPRSGLAVSILLRPAAGFPLYTLTMAAALAASDAVRALVGPRCLLKWPNDVLIDGMKVGGILLELDQSGPSWTVVIGIGLNVNAAPDLSGVGSLAAAMGHPIAREPLLIDLLARLETSVALGAREPAAILRLWRDRIVTLGQAVRVTAPDGVFAGVACDVDAEGALLVRLRDDTTRTVHAGDVTLSSQ